MSYFKILQVNLKILQSGGDLYVVLLQQLPARDFVHLDLVVMDLHSRIDDTAKAILIGLKRSGKTKTFSQILEEARVPFDKHHLFEIANELEALDLIRAVSYQLPIAIRAELTMQGHALVRELNLPEEEDAQIRTRMNGMSDKNRAAFL